uniref:Uncharacterized protein n=1 Tax=Arundo donax TaxID=35708 RepID=A0A0A9HIR0_ARUDO
MVTIIFVLQMLDPQFLWYVTGTCFSVQYQTNAEL